MPFARQSMNGRATPTNPRLPIPIDACPPRPYIAAHDNVFRDHCWRISSPPSPFRHGTRARAKARLKKPVPPVPRHFPPDIFAADSA